MSRRRVEACDSWRPPPAHAPSFLLRVGLGLRGRLSPPCAFASLSVCEGGEAVKAEGERESTAVVEASKKGRVPPVGQLLQHPRALLALAPNSVALFTARATTGAVAKTLTAPLDRVKLLMQAPETHSVRVAGESTKRGIGFLEANMEDIHRIMCSWMATGCRTNGGIRRPTPACCGGCPHICAHGLPQVSG